VTRRRKGSCDECEIARRMDINRCLDNKGFCKSGVETMTNPALEKRCGINQAKGQERSLACD